MPISKVGTAESLQMSREIDIIEQQKEVAENIAEQIEQRTGPFTGLSRKDTRRALQTFFRSSFRVQMGMVNLADRKANILVRLNSLLISGMVIFYKNITAYNDMATASVVILLLTLVASLIFATLAVRPAGEVDVDNTSISSAEAVGQMFMYTHYVKMDPLDFEESFDTMMRDPGLIYGSMARDLYQFGKVIVKKYRLLN